MIEYKMKLTDEEISILKGEQGEVKRKMMETLVLFGDIFNAKRMVKITHPMGHLVTSFGIPLLHPLYKTMDEINLEKCVAEGGFTIDPRPLDYKNVKCNLLERAVFDLVLYGKQKDYEKQLLKAGLVDLESFSCACYLKECGNRPNKGDILSWAESSAVVFANSVLGARCNRNSGMLDLFGSILGVVPEFGLLLDENRKATWVIDVKTTKVPEAQILGSAIGMKVMEEVPYIIGLDKFIGTSINDETEAYLKDMGAASASNGAVGLFHVENLTPEAKELKEKLIKEDAKHYIIDDEELERVYKSYTNMWKNKTKDPELCFIGCPHLNLAQVIKWRDDIKTSLEKHHLNHVVCEVVLTLPPKVKKVLLMEHKEVYEDLYKFGCKISSICPLMYTNNPLVHKKAIITNSNKLRTYSMARYFKDEDILKLICGERIY